MTSHLRMAMRAALARLDAGGPANIEEARRLLREGLATPGEQASDPLAMATLDKVADALRAAVTARVYDDPDCWQPMLVPSQPETRARAPAAEDAECCHKTRLRDAPCPIGRACPHGQSRNAVSGDPGHSGGPVARWAERWEPTSEPSGLSERGA